MSPVTTFVDDDLRIEIDIYNRPDRVMNLAFRKSVSTEEVKEIVQKSKNPSMRFALIGEVLDFLKNRSPLDKERVICLGPKNETGDQIVSFDSEGHAFIKVKSRWATNCRFPVALFYN